MSCKPSVNTELEEAPLTEHEEATLTELEEAPLTELEEAPLTELEEASLITCAAVIIWMSCAALSRYIVFAEKPSNAR